MKIHIALMSILKINLAYISVIENGINYIVPKIVNSFANDEAVIYQPSVIKEENQNPS